jgi:hypothetical protein
MVSTLQVSLVEAVQDFGIRVRHWPPDMWRLET